MNEKWTKLATPPAEALKKIEGGRMSGKTDINPQWRYKAMTEVYGECGVGWSYAIKRVWTEPAWDGQVFAFAEVSVYTKQGDAWSDPIPGIGGSMLIQHEKNGTHSNDEAFKMAVTDALSVALKFLGVASDVYEGKIDSKGANGGSKYEEAKGRWQPSTEMPMPAVKAQEPKASTPPLCKVRNIEIKTGPNKKGPGDWVFYRTEFDAGDDGGKFTAGTFDHKMQNVIDTANSVDAWVRVWTKQNGKYLDIQQIVMEQQPAAAASTDDDDLPF